MSKKRIKFLLSFILSIIIFVSSIGVPVRANTVSGELVCTEEGHEHNDDCYIINEEDKEEEEKEKEEITEELEDENLNVVESNNTETKNPTTDTFETVVGDYTLKNILTKYNIFSYNDIQSRHIVGPVIAKNKAYATNETSIEAFPNSQLIVSDYSKGVPSYVGIVEKVRVGSEDKSSLGLNYYFDISKDANFTTRIPNFYVDLSNNSVKKVTVNGDRYFMVSSDNTEYVAPNNTGNSPVLQNDSYVDFDKATNQIMTESNNLLKNQYNTVISLKDENNPKKYEIEPDTGYLKIDAGGNYLITDASRLRVVDIQYPDGYDPITNPYPHNTVINISGTQLVKSGESFEAKNVSRPGKDDYPINAKTFGTIAGEQHFFFPLILVNGDMFNGAKLGEGGEFSDSGNSVVWNLPNITTNGTENRVVTKSAESDILGHIIAPNAEFWNYYEDANNNVKWNGGNNNGCAIVKSWHGGVMESHMWPYGEGEIGLPVDPQVSLTIEGQKVFEGFDEGDLVDKEFNFILEMFDGGSIPDGISSQNIPQTVSQENGIIKFKPIVFTKEGEYVFRIKEAIPDSDNTDEIIYDKSEYKVQVSVTRNNNDLVTSTKVTKVKDENGNSIDSNTSSEIVFTNKKEEKTLSTEIILKAKKEFIGGDLSKNKFEFILEMFDGNNAPEGILDNNRIPQTINQDANGNVEFLPITFTKEGIYSFRIKEVISDDTDDVIYDKSEYKVDVNVSKNEDGLNATIEKITKVKDENGNEIDIDKDVTEEIIFKNKKSDEILPETGGMGKEIYVLTGMFMMIMSAMILIGRRKI